jgi:DNA-binding beta-propeller fold protein YncE
MPLSKLLTLSLTLFLLAGISSPMSAQPTPADPAAPNDADRAADEQDKAGAQALPEHPFPRHVKSPSLDGGGKWFNTAGSLDIKDLRGKFVILDFWTYCCINCMHILPELKKAEHAYPNELVVIGVHSAKFENERLDENIREAILRYEIEHPVVNDADHKIWNKFGIQSWPSLAVIDPEGNVVAINSGELTFEDLDAFFKRALPYYRARKLLDPQPLQFNLETHRAATPTPLRFPGKVLADAAGDRLFIADSNHNRIVIADLEGKLKATIGTGAMGRTDGDFATAEFDHPQGLALVGETLYVADTENHLLRKVDLRTQRVSTIAGTGKQARGGWPGMDKLELDDSGAPKLPDRWVGPPRTTALNSPWALWVHDKDLYIAMAGPHQIWKMPLDGSEIGVFAGSGREDIVDGPVLPKRPYGEFDAAFAQPSGLASDGEWLYVADSEGSSVRAVPFDPKKEVRTVVGTSKLPGGRLFIFGDRDGAGLLELGVPEIAFRGEAEQTDGVLLQHCLGVVHHQGRLFVADTYNNKIKVIDISEKKPTCRTVAGTGKPGREDAPAQFDEPAGISAAGDKLYVADTNNHLIRVIDLKNDNAVTTLNIAGLKPPKPPAKAQKPALPGAAEIAVKPQTVRAADGKLKLRVTVDLPEGWKINPIAPQKYFVELSGEKGVVDRAAVAPKFVRLDKPSVAFDVELPLTTETGHETLKLGLAYYYCQEGAEGLCRAAGVVWAAPIKVDPQSKSDVVELKVGAE